MDSFAIAAAGGGEEMMIGDEPPPPGSAGLLWDRVMEYTKAAGEKGIDPLAWAIQVSSDLCTAGVAIPSTDLAVAMVSHLCWGNNVPAAWKYLEKAISAKMAPPMLVLALLSSRVIPARRSRPAAYRLYMELLKRHMFSFASQISGPSCKKIMIFIDDVLHLSEMFGIQPCEPGILVVEFVFCIIWQLLDAALDDEGLQELMPEKKSSWPTRPQEMKIDEDDFNGRRIENYDRLRKMNTLMSIEIVGQLLHHKVISRLLCLARLNMPLHWEDFSQCFLLLGSNSSTFQSSSLSPESIQKLLSLHKSKSCSQQPVLIQEKGFNALASSGTPSSTLYCHGASRTSLWLPLDLFLEDAMDGSVAATNAIEILSGLVKALQAVNGTSWHDTFLGLWMAALRLVQRERDPIESPVPRLQSRLCFLLSITTLSIADIIEEEEAAQIDESRSNITGQWKEKSLPVKRRNDLVSSLQVLGNFEGLLTPPQPIISVANQAAAKAMMFVSGVTVGSGSFESINVSDMKMNFSGNLRHLIVEACIARNLLDTSAYCWPGYVNGRITQLPHLMSGQVPGWSTFMKGAPLTSSMINALVLTPVSSLAELEKIYEIAIKGSDDEKISVATIICGASLLRGWNMQEHTIRYVLKMLSPPPPADYTGSDSHLISYAPMLNVILTGISAVDCVQVFSLHGLVPELAGVLMPICEVFGSCIPNVKWTLPTEDVSAYSVFSNAFILLMRLWKFNHPPLEYCIMGDAAPVGSQLTPEYLLLLRNSQVISDNFHKKCSISWRLSASANSLPTHPIYVDSFPKLKVWYRQHQACLASTLSGLVHGSLVHQNVEGLLSMMFRKINKGGSQSVGPGSSGSSSLSSSSGPGNEDSALRPKLPAWEIMEAVPFVVDAALTACSHGKLSPRELATGLKDLADFLPASLATMVSYFSAEVTRGIWKPAFMNGTDWPSPAANLSTVEEHIKKIVAATGVDVPSLAAGGNSPSKLPLPLAAFVSLTITYKLDRAAERFLNLAGPALELLAASCPWPSMPIVASLWSQKVRKWTDFFVFSASRTVFHHNNDAVGQLLKSCFSATLGVSSTSISSNGGIGNLLGHGVASHFAGGLSPVAPGILYLRIYRCIRDIMLVIEDILSLLMLSVKEIASNGMQRERLNKLKKAKYGMQYGHVSLVAAMTKVKLAASLGASLVWLSGGSGLIQALFAEMLPSWFLSVNGSESEGGLGGMVPMLGGYALAHFAVLCGMFAWGIESTCSKRRPRIIGSHMEFLAGVLDKKISLGCDMAVWRAYVSGFVKLMVECAPAWVLELEVDVLKRVSNGLRQWEEDELAFSLLESGGIRAMGAAAELIISSE
ncbi:Mediator of RNA polymerase II transcription subunit 33A [Acorus gramineus]|uniref:Mediator of RNA polymerase II transcription subunit 33A n=1 Tax=Acorus gramineus TaxID=55184 RepID=A0AAV9BL77_ACOGR|nr:Mediator of RNA polymerase II transcription subunit 33A [Acorus gramineus]